MVEEGEGVLDEGTSLYEGEQDMIWEVLSRNDAPEDIFVEQFPWVYWDRRRLLLVTLNVLGVRLVVLFFIPLNVVGSLQTLHELTKAQCGYRLLH